MIKRVIYSAVIALFIILIAFGLIAYGRGYRLDFKQKSLTPTGILSATSFPEGASIWIDDKLKSATNTSLSLPPGWYNLKVRKEGYKSWEKRVRVQGEVVTRIDALLVPTNPSLKSLTNSGILSPVLSPSGSRVAFIIPDEEATFSSSLKSKKGVWTLDLRYGPLGGRSEARQIFTQQAVVDWPNSQLFFSPDEKQILLKFIRQETLPRKEKKEIVTSALLLSVDDINSIPLDVTLTFADVENEWKTTTEKKHELTLTTLPTLVSTMLDNSASRVDFSPDETKILYLSTSSATLSPIITPPIIGTNSMEEIRKIEPGKYYIYDVKEDKNFYVAQQSLKDANSLFWYTDSKHILMIEKDSIYIIDYDGTNKRMVYSGPFEDNIVYPWPTPGRLVILTNFNKPKSLPDLYEIDLR